MGNTTQVTLDDNALALLRSILDQNDVVVEPEPEEPPEQVASEPAPVEDLTQMYTKHDELCGKVVQLTCGSDRCEHRSYVTAGTPKAIGSRTPSRVKDDEKHDVVVTLPEPMTPHEAFEGVAAQMQYACREIGCGFFSYKVEPAVKHRDTKKHRVARRVAKA